MRGKYSPTVCAAYMHDQSWHDKLLATQGTFDKDGNSCESGLYDVDGYDSYGYNSEDVDRAGNNEYDYCCDDTDEYGDSLGFNSAYDQAVNDWGFDSTRPVQNA